MYSLEIRNFGPYVLFKLFGLARQKIFNELTIIVRLFRVRVLKQVVLISTNTCCHIVKYVGVIAEVKDFRGWQFLTMKAAEILCIVCLPPEEHIS